MSIIPDQPFSRHSKDGIDPGLTAISNPPISECYRRSDPRGSMIIELGPDMSKISPLSTFKPSSMHPLTHRGVNQRSEEHKSELQSLMRISYAVFSLENK